MARPQLFLKYPFPPHELFTIECERPVRLLPADCLVGLCKLCTPISAEVASFFSPFKSPRAWCATRLPTVEPHNWRRPIADFGSLLLIVRDWQLSRRLTSYINEWYGTIIIINSNRLTSCRGYGGRVWRWTTSDFNCVFHFFCAWTWCSPLAFCQMQIEQNSANCC